MVVVVAVVVEVESLGNLEQMIKPLLNWPSGTNFVISWRVNWTDSALPIEIKDSSQHSLFLSHCDCVSSWWHECCRLRSLMSCVVVDEVVALIKRPECNNFSHSRIKRLNISFSFKMYMVRLSGVTLKSIQSPGTSSEIKYSIPEAKFFLSICWINLCNYIQVMFMFGYEMW